MPIAIISDIHGNLDALDAVLADLDRRGVQQVLCLGDVIGYGPEPVGCLDRVRQRCEWTLMGNHDFAVLYEPTSFNPAAESAAFWTREQFEAEEEPDQARCRWHYLGGLPLRQQQEGALWVHASPRRPMNDYLFPDDVITAPTKMQEVFQGFDRRCFVGHTHIPGVFTDEPEFYAPAELGGDYQFTEKEKAVINPGSVGQPRDRDPRAAYVLYHPEQDRVEFQRLPYDIDAAAAKIHAEPRLHDFLGQRLKEGR